MTPDEEDVYKIIADEIIYQHKNTGDSRLKCLLQYLIKAGIVTGKHTVVAESKDVVVGTAEITQLISEELNGTYNPTPPTIRAIARRHLLGRLVGKRFLHSMRKWKSYIGGIKESGTYNRR